MGKGTRCAWPFLALAVAACSGNAFTIEPSKTNGRTDGGSSSSGGGSSGGGSSSSGGGSSGGGSSSGGSSSGGESDGGSDGASDAGAGSDAALTAFQACGVVVTSICDKLQLCAPYLLETEFGNVSTCYRRQKLTCSSLLATGSGANISNLEACAAAYALATCDALVSNRSPAACNFQGSLAAGSSCVAPAQCSGSDMRCSIPAGQRCGVCAPRVAAGQGCAGDRDCQTGLVCAKQNNAATGACAVPGGQAAACDPSHPCLATLGCAANNTCEPPLAAGAACTAQNCNSLDGLYCDTRTGVCAQILAAGLGATCGVAANGTLTSCAAGAKCKMPDGSTTGTCEGTALDGANCDATNGPPCLPPSSCVSGVCTLPDTSCH
jgi:hypothetical protein